MVRLESRPHAWSGPSSGQRGHRAGGPRVGDAPSALPLALVMVLSVSCGRHTVPPPPAVAACPALVEVPVAGPLPGRCARIERVDVGRLPFAVHPGGRVVTLAEWTQVDERSDAVVGFAAHLPPDVMYAVSSGGEVYLSSSPRWLHPRGVLSGRGIDSVTFCRLPGPPSCRSRPVPVALTGSDGAQPLVSRNE